MKKKKPHRSKRLLFVNAIQLWAVLIKCSAFQNASHKRLDKTKKWCWSVFYQHSSLLSVLLASLCVQVSNDIGRHRMTCFFSSSKRCWLNKSTMSHPQIYSNLLQVLRMHNGLKHNIIVAQYFFYSICWPKPIQNKRLHLHGCRRESSYSLFSSH